MKNITKIVLTGGPCGGKTSSLKIIRKYFENKGFSVFVSAEPVTELMFAGITPTNVTNYFDFQDTILKMYMEKERVLLDYVCNGKVQTKENVLIIFDRGILDIKAYMLDEEFDKLLKLNNLTIDKIIGKYDAVFHLVTTAKGAEKFYGTETNSTRYESLEDAIKTDDRTLDCWNVFKNLKIIDNSTSFDEKMSRLIAGIEKIVDHANV